MPESPHLHGVSNAYKVTHDRDWYHAVLVFRGPEDCLGYNLYFNGGYEIDTQWKVQMGAPVPSTDNEALGRLILGAVKSDDNTTYHPDLVIDEILMWNKALTRGQVKQLYGSYDRAYLN